MSNYKYYTRTEYFKDAQDAQDFLDTLVSLGARPYDKIKKTETRYGYNHGFDKDSYSYVGVDTDGDTWIYSNESVYKDAIYLSEDMLELFMEEHKIQKPTLRQKLQTITNTSLTSEQTEEIRRAVQEGYV